MERPNLKPEILKAIFVLTSNNPSVTVGLSDIVNQVRMQINGLLNFPRSRKTKENLIKSTIYAMRNNAEIGYEGRNKYSLGRTAICTPEEKLHKPEKVPPAHFQVPSRKRLLETNTPLNPAKKRRYSSENSSSSCSGDNFEKTRKQFYGIKKLEKHDFNPQLPKVRQANFNFADMNPFVNLPGPSRQPTFSACDTSLFSFGIFSNEKADKSHSNIVDVKEDSNSSQDLDEKVDENAENTKSFKSEPEESDD